MRRAVIVLLMMLLPLQTAWAAVAGISGHLGGEVMVSGLHSHDHDHGHDHDGKAQHGHELAFATDMDADHNADGHHDSHCHPVFSYITPPSGLLSGVVLHDGPIPQLTVTFASYTPPVVDRPPLARA